MWKPYMRSRAEEEEFRKYRKYVDISFDKKFDQIPYLQYLP